MASQAAKARHGAGLREIFGMRRGFAKAVTTTKDAGMDTNREMNEPEKLEETSQEELKGKGVGFAPSNNTEQTVLDSKEAKMKTNVFVSEPEVFESSVAAKNRASRYQRYLKEYEAELEIIKRLLKDRDDPAQLEALAKYIRPKDVVIEKEEETSTAERYPNVAGVQGEVREENKEVVGGGTYMSRLDRIIDSLKNMMETLEDDDNAEKLDAKQLQDLMSRIRQLQVVSDQLDKNVHSVDFEALYNRQFDEDDDEDDNNAYEIPQEYYYRYDQATIAKARAIITMYLFFQNVFKKFGRAPISVILCTVGAFVLVVANIIIAVEFFRHQVQNLLFENLRKNPTNAQMQDYNISKIGGMRSSYSTIFMSFVIINAVAVVVGGLGIWRMIQNKNTYRHRTPGLVSAVLYASLCQALLGFVASLVLFVLIRRRLKQGASRINAFNMHVYKNVHKNGSFLKNLQSIPSNSFSLMTVVRNSLLSLPKEASATEIAQAMFTLNMYMHYQKLGYRNPELSSALSHVFNVVGLLRKAFYSPADYLFRKATFIKDHGDIMRDVLIKNVEETNSTDVKFMDAYSAKLDEASMKATEWTAEANNLANSFYPEDALRLYLRLYIISLIYQTLPLLVLLYVFKKKTIRDAFLIAIGVMNRKQPQLY